MNKRTIFGYVAIGTAIVAVGTYLYKRSVKKKEQEEVDLQEANEELLEIAEMVGESVNADLTLRKEIPSIIKGVQKVNKAFDIEFRNEYFIKFLSSLSVEDKVSFTHSYLYLKRSLMAKYGIEFIGKKDYVHLLSCLFYTLEKKVNRGHPDRGILKESVEAVADEFLYLMQDPTVAFNEEKKNFAQIFLKGEDLSKISHLRS